MWLEMEWCIFHEAANASVLAAPPQCGPCCQYLQLFLGSLCLLLEWQTGWVNYHVSSWDLFCQMSPRNCYLEFFFSSLCFLGFILYSYHIFRRFPCIFYGTVMLAVSHNTTWLYTIYCLWLHSRLNTTFKFRYRIENLEIAIRNMKQCWLIKGLMYFHSAWWNNCSNILKSLHLWLAGANVCIVRIWVMPISLIACG